MLFFLSAISATALGHTKHALLPEQILQAKTFVVDNCPKTYELRRLTFLIRIASFQDGYLMSGGFVGSPVPGPVESVCSLDFCLPLGA
jgi:hypothetical protein